MKGKKLPQRPTQEVRVRVNHMINAPEVRLIGSDGKQIGVVSSRQALALAEEEGLDLVEIAAAATPPVCRIMDHGKYRFEQSKKAQEAKKKQTVVEVKEIKFRPKTEEHDLAFKIRNIRKFLEQKNKVKVTLRFRGREIAYADQYGMQLLTKVGEAIADVGVVVQPPKMEGRQMAMFLGPKH
ncbi:MAG: translation initiation factor IF-3 [Thermodesulfobacteriota bacterium]